MVPETRDLVLDHSALHLLSAVSFCPRENGGSKFAHFLTVCCACASDSSRDVTVHFLTAYVVN